VADDPVKIDPADIDPMKAGDSAEGADAAQAAAPGEQSPRVDASETETIEFSPDEFPPDMVAEAGEPEVGEPEAGKPEVGEPEANQDDSASDEANSSADELDDGLDDDLDGEPEPEPPVAPAGPIELAEEEEEEIKKDWYILKVQSNRERSIAAALQRKVAIEGIEHLFGQILVPVEKVTEFKGGKKKVVERKLWPGYIAVEMHVNDDTWFAIRETGGIGDFTGSGGAPTPMEPHEIAKILHQDEEETDDTPKLNIKFTVGEKVKVKEGNFENFEGEVATIDEASGKVSVMISIFGRSTPVELEYWQVETL